MNRSLVASLFVAASCLLPSMAAAAPADDTVEFLNSPQAGTTNLPFSEAVRVGDLLFLSGQIGVDTRTDTLVSGGMKAEARQTMENIGRSLEANGYSMRDIVKCTVMLADMAEWQAFNEVYVSFFSRPYPARSAFGATGLALGARVEVECVAARATPATARP